MLLDTIRIVLHFHSFSVTLDPFLVEDPSSLICNYPAACQFVSNIQHAVYDLVQSSHIAFMYPLSFVFTSKLLVYIPIRVRYNYHKHKYSSQFVLVHSAIYF